VVSSLIVWTLGFMYAVGYLLAFRRIAGQLAWHFVGQDRLNYPTTYGNRKFPSGEQWSGAIFGSALLSLVWPLSIPVAYSIAGSRSGAGLLYMPPVERERIMSARIAELEREAGIR